MNTSYMRLSLRDREEISRGIWASEKFSVIAERIGRPTSTVSREVWSKFKYSWSYTAEKAQRCSNELRARGRPKKLDKNQPLKEYVYSKLKIRPGLYLLIKRTAIYL